MIAMNGIVVLIFIIGCYLRVSQTLSGDNVCTKPSETNSSVTISFCCSGYIQNGDVCAACDPWKFGLNCSQTCLCVQNNTKACGNVVGDCDCKPGYQGQLCDTECSDGKFDTNCLNNCACPINAFDICDKVTGACTCKPGYTGADCNTECIDGFHGDSCQQRCSCPTNANPVCNKENGTCTCLPGWIGPDCETVCPDGMFGNDCKKKCACPVNAFSICDKENGQCTCLSGFGGKNCRKECDDWTFGSGCFGRCQCNINETFKCDKETGICICKENYGGTNCSVYIPPETELRTNYVVVGIGSAVGILTFIWIIVAVVCIFGHIRKRRRLLSAEKYSPDSNNVQSRETDEGEQSLGIYRNEVYEPDNEPASQVSQGEPQYENTFVTAHASGKTQSDGNAGSEKNLYEALNKPSDTHIYEQFKKPT